MHMVLSLFGNPPKPVHAKDKSQYRRTEYLHAHSPYRMFWTVSSPFDTEFESDWRTHVVNNGDYPGSFKEYFRRHLRVAQRLLKDSKAMVRRVLSLVRSPLNPLAFKGHRLRSKR